MPKRSEEARRNVHSRIMQKKQLPMPLLGTKEMEDLRNGTLEIDCPNITLKGQSPQDPRIYRGPGHIKQSLEGQFSFKLYSSQESKPDEYLRKLFSRKSTRAGQIIPQHEYYNLEAIDLYGRRWKSIRILPTPFFSRLKRGIVLTGRVRELTSKINATSISRPYLNIKIFEKIDFPANQGTTSTIRVSKKETAKSWQLNAAKFESCGNKFFITKKDEMINIDVSSDKNIFADNIEMRVIEALQFVLARPIRWSILEKREGKVIIIRTRPPRHDDSSLRSHPPINYPTIDHTNCAWKLYDRYLQYILKCKKNDWHPLSSRIYQVYRASGYSYFTQALILCTEIEGILNEEFSNLAIPSSESLSLIKNAQKYMCRWEKTDYIKEKIESGKKELEDEVSKLKSRIDGLFGLIAKPRPIDKLRTLAQSKSIIKEHSDVWNKLRRMTAHAHPPDSLDTQQFIDDFYKVLVLFYQLIFHAIGYKGKYTDYSKHGWQIKNYPPS